MSTLLWSSLCILALISVTDGLSCLVCSSATNVACNDPPQGDAAMSNSMSQPGFISCLKTQYFTNWGPYPANVIIREGSGQACTSALTVGNVANLFCCSDKENCNGATAHTARISGIITLSIGCLFAKRMFLC